MWGARSISKAVHESLKGRAYPTLRTFGLGGVGMERVKSGDWLRKPKWQHMGMSMWIPGNQAALPAHFKALFPFLSKALPHSIPAPKASHGCPAHPLTFTHVAFILLLVSSLWPHHCYNITCMCPSTRLLTCNCKGWREISAWNWMRIFLIFYSYRDMEVYVVCKFFIREKSILSNTLFRPF